MIGPIAQLVEQQPFKLFVGGSIPPGLKNRLADWDMLQGERISIPKVNSRKDCG